MGEWFPTFYGPIGLQVMHRLGAYTLTFCIVGMFLATFKLVARGQLDRQSQVLSSQMLLFVFSQIAIGVMNLKLQIPGWLTVVHLAVALMIFMSILKMNIKTFHFKK
jgi:heme A synthase